ncbi:hypothetical protein FRB94_003948 [Tulasnella sp. JGI-2019a]|nr:hypothetical protein FRB94_003948 [Tulasnella sp. JGI-2019a]KAG9008200.1 hypothetical protein FRB93_006768 [Tulasnella sp. JGI-2019a]
MKHLAEPVLYARLCITENTLEHINRLLVVDEASIEYAKGDLGAIYLQPGTATQKARFVQSLAIPRLNFVSGAKDLHEIASILCAARSTLSRLFATFFDSSFWCTPGLPILKAALLELSNIEEFCLAPDLTPIRPRTLASGIVPQDKTTRDT